MGFWSQLTHSFGGKKDKDLPPGKKSHYQGDMNKTTLIQQLFQIPKDKRDANWQQQFLANVADAAFACANPQVVKGPDDFPYFILNLPQAFQNFQAFTIRNMTEDFMLESGYGIVMNPKGNAADWVFSYGDIVNFHISGVFYDQIDAAPVQRQETLVNQTMMTSQPSEKILPKKTRSVLKDFLKAMGISHPKVMLVTRDVDGKKIQELAFNLRPADFPSNRHYEFTMEHLSWYLPRHYTILTFPQSSEEEKGFADL